MSNSLSVNTRKSLCVQLGEQAGTELAQHLAALAQQIEELKAENQRLRNQIEPPAFPRIARVA